jgi:ferredoxin--NADP+ reductase
MFLCGNPAMIGVPIRDRKAGTSSYPTPTGMVELLEGRGFRSDQHHTKFVGNIHFEEYW